MLERILCLMKEKKINKNQLAILTGLPRTTIYSALLSEESCKKAKLETIRPIAQVLNTTLDYIILGNEERKVEDKNNYQELECNNYEYLIILNGVNGDKTTYKVDEATFKILTLILEKVGKEDK